MTTVGETLAALKRKFIFPIAIRDECVVQIGGLPIDLTRAEADRIVLILQTRALHHSDDRDVGVVERVWSLEPASDGVAP